MIAAIPWPPRGTQAVVLKMNQNVGAAHPQTFYKAFSWDQTYRKTIAYDASGNDKLTPLWRVDDPLKVAFDSTLLSSACVFMTAPGTWS